MKIRKHILIPLLCISISLFSACDSQTADLVFTNQQAISAGPFQLIGLKKDGSVVCFADPSIYKEIWGDAVMGQFDVSTWSDIVSVDADGLFDVGYFYAVGLRHDGTVVFTDNSVPGAKKPRFAIDHRILSKWKDIVAVSAGMTFVAGLKSDGTVVCTDVSGFGQNSIKNWKNVTAISAGSHLAGLKQDGTVVATAFTDYGDEPVLGNVSSWKNIFGIAAGYGNTLGLKQDGTVVVTGWRDYLFTSVYEWKDITKIYCSGDSAIGMTKDGRIVSTRDRTDLSKWNDISEITANADIIAGLKKDGTVIVYGLDGDFSSWKDICIP